MQQSELRQFGYVMAGFIALGFGLLFPWLSARDFSLYPWIIAAAFTLTGLLLPAWLKPVFFLWTLLGKALGRVTSPVILAVFFYLLIWPTGLLRKLLGGDPLCRRYEPDAPSYFKKPDTPGRNHMEDPY